MKNACMTIKRQRPNLMQNIVHTDILYIHIDNFPFSPQVWGSLHNITNIVYRPEEALEIQSELIFVNGMVHLPQE